STSGSERRRWSLSILFLASLLRSFLHSLVAFLYSPAVDSFGSSIIFSASFRRFLRAVLVLCDMTNALFLGGRGGGAHLRSSTTLQAASVNASAVEFMSAVLFKMSK